MKNKLVNKNLPFPQKIAILFKLNDNLFFLDRLDCELSKRRRANKAMKNISKAYIKYIQYQIPNSFNSIFNGANKRIIDIDEAKTLDGVVKKCSSKNVVNDNISKVENKIIFAT